MLSCTDDQMPAAALMDATSTCVCLRGDAAAGNVPHDAAQGSKRGHTALRDGSLQDFTRARQVGKGTFVPHLENLLRRMQHAPLPCPFQVHLSAQVPLV